MTEKSLNHILIIFILICLTFLFLFSYFFTPPKLNLLEDNQDYLNKIVIIKGDIKNLTLKENNLFFDVCNYSKCLSTVYFNISNNNFNIVDSAYKSKKSISVTGKLIEYNGELEIILYKYEIK